MAQEQMLERSEEWHRYALALEASQEGFWDWDLVAGQLWGSHRWQSITGLNGPCSDVSCWMERVHPCDKPRFEAELRALRAGKAKTVQNEHRIRHQDGRWRWVLARCVASEDAAGRITHVAGSLSDNTDRRTADALTGLPNRFFFVEHLERRMERARLLGDWNFAILAVAIDRFERVNETLGSGGDRLLMETSLRLQRMLPPLSVAARVTGAEFLICLEPAGGPPDAARFACAAAEAIREPFVWRGHRVTPQLAVGIAVACPEYAHPEDLMGDAESALTNAHSQESTGVVCYSSGMRERALDKLEMEADLERAIRQGELSMFYQPEVDLRTNRIIGFEALVRWRHAHKGLLLPAQFIPLAEETGLILPLGDWGLVEACRQLVEWRSTGNPEMQGTRISVNLSARQFERPDLVERVEQVLRETRLDAASLRLEVTESCLISDAVSTLKTMRQLGQLGVGLHMDDFGMGYSSLHYLQRFPFDTLKIDRSFVQGIATDSDSRRIVRSILELARSLGVNVVAEGIEDTAQLEELKSLDCPCGQGFLFARPMEPAAVHALVASGNLPGDRGSSISLD